MRGFWIKLGVTGFLASGGLLVWIFGIHSVLAASPNVSKSYDSSKSISAGNLVSFDSSRDGYVEAANTDNSARLFGVVVGSDESLVAINPEKNKVQVATSGSALALVSSVNGNIKAGDQIGASPFTGIGMRANQRERIIGLALSGFSNKTSGARSERVITKNGHTQNIYVGLIRVSIVPGTSSDQQSDKLSALQKAVQSLTGRTIATWRIIVSLVVLTGAFIVLVTLIYSAVYSGIVSIGRNPLAKYSVFRALGSIAVMSVSVVIVAILSIFLLLR